MLTAKDLTAAREDEICCQDRNHAISDQKHRRAWRRPAAPARQGQGRAGMRSGPARAPPRPRTPLQAPQDLLAAALLVRQGAVELAPLKHDLLLAPVQLARHRCVLRAPGAPDVPRAVDRCGAEQQGHLRASKARVFLAPERGCLVRSENAERAGATGASAGDRRAATAACLGQPSLGLAEGHVAAVHLPCKLAS